VFLPVRGGGRWRGPCRTLEGDRVLAEETTEYMFRHPDPEVIWAALRATALTLLPTLLLVTYGYLRDHDFYSQRPGSYPVYPNKLQNSVLLDSQIKPIKNFFSIDKNE